MSLNLIRTILENPGCAKGSSWALLIAMADRADDDGTGVYASIRVIAENCGISERTAWDALKPLLEAKIVIDTGEIKDWGRGHFTHVYRIDQSAISALGMLYLQQSAKSSPGCGKRNSRVQNSLLQSAKSACKPVLKPVPSSLRSEEPVQEIVSQLVSSRPPAPKEPEGDSLSDEQTGLVEEFMNLVYDQVWPYRSQKDWDEAKPHAQRALSAYLFDPDWLLRCLIWALDHPHWKKCTHNMRNFADHLEKEGENTLVTQFLAHEKKLERKPAKKGKLTHQTRPGHCDLGEDDPPRSVAPSRVNGSGSVLGAMEEREHGFDVEESEPEVRGFDVVAIEEELG